LCPDPVAGIPAFRLLKPAHWVLEGGPFWTMRSPFLPGDIAFRVYNPHEHSALELISRQMFAWQGGMNSTSGGWLQRVLGSLSAVALGGSYFGLEVRAPMTAIQTLQEIILPRARGNVGPVEILECTPHPDLPKLGSLLISGVAPIPPHNEGIRCRLRYGNWEEELITLLTYEQIGPVLVWATSFTFAFRARRGALAATLPLIRTIMQSFRLNPHWMQYCRQVIDQMAAGQIQQIQQLGAWSRQFSQQSHSLVDIVRQHSRDMDQITSSSWDAYSQTMDGIFDRVSQANRGVDTYIDPSSSFPVDLPNDYQYAWSNGLGEYVLSNDANYNPNLGTNVNWTELQRKG
jgi:hypothetical protein